MKRSAQRHRVHRHKKIKELKSGFFESPAFHGLMAMLPVVAILFVIALQTGIVRASAERNLFLELGKGAESPALYYQLANEAVKRGDLNTARKAYFLTLKSEGPQVLGASSELEEKLWPEKRWQREWSEVELLFFRTNSAKVLLRAALIKFELNETQEARKYWGLAYEADPNDEEVVRVREILGL